MAEEEKKGGAVSSGSESMDKAATTDAETVVKHEGHDGLTTESGATDDDSSSNALKECEPVVTSDSDEGTKTW